MEKPNQVAVDYLLWAKYEKQSGRIHPLVYHMIDVGAVAWSLWRLVLTEQTRRKFSEWIGLGNDTCGKQLAFWASLHDIGKAAPGFQRKLIGFESRLNEFGLKFPSIKLSPAPHGWVSAWALEKLLPELTELNSQDAKQIARALGGHHGAWPIPRQLSPQSLLSSDKGDETWQAARRQLICQMMSVFEPMKQVALPVSQVERNAFTTLFSGFVSVADWIGSMDDYFPYTEEVIAPQEYSQRAIRQAENALQVHGWRGWKPDGKTLPFMDMFPFAPNETQAAVIDAARDISQPCLLILEAPTGCGKTEAALYLADTWIQQNRGRGLYIAMPTQATSNQMYQRVIEFLVKRYPLDTLNLHLIHGAALLGAHEQKEEPTNIMDEGSSSQEGGVRAQSWFLPRKRTLLAPFGIGTVDQALMSILQTRHFFVRLFGLGQKVVIFDEIHAYDTYMSVLFQQLLAWLRSIGTSVILLSATLPEQTRKKLTAAWLGDEQAQLAPACYPRLTMIDDKESATIELPSPPTRTITLEQKPGDALSITALLDEKLKDGGCAAIICNRVARAQEIYRAIQAKRMAPTENVILLHGRFPFAWRKDIEERVLGLFSKEGKRPKKAIVVATQVIEQSLDLDFDIMISDHAPIDLILQRVGRLHRHPVNDATRPKNLSHPQIILAIPDFHDGIPDFGRDEWVYDRSILLRSWWVMNQRKRLTLPEDTNQLIEAVYGNELDIPDQAWQAALAQADEKTQRASMEEITEAKKRLVPRPDDDSLLFSRNENLEEDNPTTHNTFRALTRLIDPGVSLVCLHQTAAGLALEPDGAGAPIDIDQKPDPFLTNQLLQRAVTIQRKDVLFHFLDEGVPPAWKENSALRHHFLAIFDEQGHCNLEGIDIELVLNRESGLEIVTF